MLDPLSIRICHVFLNPQRDKKIAHQFVALPGFVRQSPPVVSQKNGSIPFRGNQIVPLQSLDRIVDRRIGHTEPLGQINHPRLTGLVDQICNQLDIIFSNLRLMRLAHPSKVLRLSLDRRLVLLITHDRIRSCTTQQPQKRSLT